MPRPLKTLWYWPAKRSVTRWLVRIWILRTAFSCSRVGIPATVSITCDRPRAQKPSNGGRVRPPPPRALRPPPEVADRYHPGRLIRVRPTGPEGERAHGHEHSRSPMPARDALMIAPAAAFAAVPGPPVVTVAVDAPRALA